MSTVQAKSALLRGTKPRCTLYFLMVLALVATQTFWSTRLSAQQLPTPLEPAQLERQFDEKKLPSAQPMRPALPIDTVRGAEIRSETIATLRKIVVDDMTKLDVSVVESVLDRYSGRDISLADAEEMARMLTAEYRNAGYILSQVFVPPQRIQDGVLTLQAVEGFIDKVSIRGRVLNSSDLLDRYVCKIMSSKPLHSSVLERNLLLAESLPGIKVNAVLQPSSTTPGASHMELFVQEERFEGFASFDNRGARFSGPNQLQLAADLNSILGIHDQTSIRVIGASQFSELRMLEVAHEQVIRSDGLTLRLSGRYTESEPGGLLKDSEFESESTSGRATLNYPFIRSRARNLFGRVSLDFRDTNTTVLSDAFTEDKIATLRASLALDFADRWNGINLFDVTLSRGLDLFDASQQGDPLLSRAGAEPEYFKTNLSILRLQRMGHGFSLLLNAEGQYSPDTLVAAEEFALGGSVFGRGFDPSQVSGERGFATRAELRYDSALGAGLFNSSQLYAFYDYGTVWRRSSMAAPSSTETLASTGAGWRFYFGKRAAATLEVAKPTIGDNLSEQNDDPRFLFEVSYQF